MGAQHDLGNVARWHQIAIRLGRKAARAAKRSDIHAGHRINSDAECARRRSQIYRAQLRVENGLVP